MARIPKSNTRNLLCLCSLVAMFCAKSALADYSTQPDAVRLVDEMVSEHGFNASELKAVLANAKRQDKIIEAISRPAEKTMPWFKYRQIFLGSERIDEGVTFWQRNAAALIDAQTKLGVAPEYVVAIIGVETRFGKHRGTYRVLDALTTLAFDYPPRASFFRSELKQFLLLAREENKPAEMLMGSYAGAMGYGQFISSSYRRYAIDFDGDGQRDIWDNPRDVIGSVANYLAEHRWTGKDPVLIDLGEASGALQPQAANELGSTSTLGELRRSGVTIETTLPDTTAVAIHGFQFENEQRVAIGFNDFYAITRYNHSIMYARAVHELAQEIKTAYLSTNPAGKP